MESTGRYRRMIGSFDEIEIAGLRRAYELAVGMAKDRLQVDAAIERKLANVLVTTYRRGARSMAAAPAIEPEELATLSLERFTALLAYENKEHLCPTP